ncbi:MAG: VWA domain-containing protein [Bacteroidota bacterium]|nr:VWA domain-containing protein [Bacteroidota bacterium]
MFNLTFANPGFLFLLLLLIPLVAWYVIRRNRIKPTIQVSDTARIGQWGNTLKVKLRHTVFVLRVLALAAVIIVLARPQSTDSKRNVSTEGIDIMITLDLSSTMLARDFNPDRLEAAKDVAIEFISGRPSDRIGLVVFSSESFTQCPLTSDHAKLINLFKDVQSGMIQDGTAIGMGLATAVSRLKESNSKSKVIILLTDGDNNAGSIAPLTAAEIAKTFGIRVYTIGVGSRGMASIPVQTPVGVQMIDAEVKIDEKMLTDIAKMTDGKYYRATNKKKLQEIYQDIDKLEKSNIKVTEYNRRQDEYIWFALFAGLCLFIELLLRYTVFRTIP